MAFVKKALGKFAELLRKLAKIKKVAPPPPPPTLYRWLTKVYRLRRTLGDARKELLALAKKNGIKTGDVLLRTIIEETASDHVGGKMRWKYAVVLEKALTRKVKSKDLRAFIEGEGGINAGSRASKPKAPKASWPMSRKSNGAKPSGLKPFRT